MSRIGGFKTRQAESTYHELYSRVRAQWPPDTEDVYVRTRYGVTHAIRHGAGEPMILLPGNGGTAANWSTCAPALGERHTVIALDILGQPGLGVQHTPLRGPRDLSTWIGDVMYGLGVEDAHFCGLSYGAWVATLVALHAPFRVRTLALTEPAGNTFGRMPLSSVPAVLRLLCDRSESGLARFGRHVEGGWPSDFDHRRLVNFGMADYRVRLPLMRYHTDAELRRITQPTLVLVAGASVAHNPAKVVHRARTLLPNAKVELIAGAPHPLPETHPQVVTGHLTNWLSAVA
jgi:pimeloyl-ACP methyl ester carboxylesterase